MHTVAIAAPLGSLSISAAAAGSAYRARAGAAASRQATQAYRFFECAAPSRQAAGVRYEVNVLGLGVMFVLFDVDLLLFVPELLNLHSMGLGDLAIVAGLLVFFAAGLWCDHSRFGFEWVV